MFIKKLIAFHTFFFVAFLFFAQFAIADTIGNYMIISDNIPQMELKPDEVSQAWARSARNIITSTNETMAQTIISMNALAAKQGHPIFCFSPATPFDATTVDTIIKKTYADIIKNQGPSPSMSVSDVLIMGMSNQYSCSTSMQPASTAAPITSSSPPNPYAQPPTQVFVSSNNNSNTNPNLPPL